MFCTDFIGANMKALIVLTENFPLKPNFSVIGVILDYSEKAGKA